MFVLHLCQNVNQIYYIEGDFLLVLKGNLCALGSKETGFPNNTINIYWGKTVSFNSNRQKLLLETSKKITLLLRFEECRGWGRRRVVNEWEMNFMRHIHECVSNELQLA